MDRKSSYLTKAVIFVLLALFSVSTGYAYESVIYIGDPYWYLNLDFNAILQFFGVGGSTNF